MSNEQDHTGDTLNMPDFDGNRDHSASFKTHYNEFLHPNVEDADENRVTGCMSCWDRFDDKYIRPCLVYKYDRLKYRPEFEIEDVLNEYKIIEEELNDDTATEV